MTQSCGGVDRRAASQTGLRRPVGKLPRPRPDQLNGASWPARMQCFSLREDRHGRLREYQQRRHGCRIGSETNRACSDPGGCSRPISKPCTPAIIGWARFAQPYIYRGRHAGSGFKGDFSQFTPQTAGTFQDPFRFASIGSCLVRAGSAEAIGPAPGTGLDAGPQIVVHGPNGDNTLGQLWYAPGRILRDVL